MKIYIIFLLIPCYVSSQSIIYNNINCDGKVYINNTFLHKYFNCFIDLPEEGCNNINYFSFIDSYLDTTTTIAKSHRIFSKAELIQINKPIGIKNRICFISDSEKENIFCEILISEVSFNEQEYNFGLLKEINQGYVEFYTNYKYTKIDTIILKLNGKNIVIDKANYDDLISPNTTSKYGYITPINLYYSKTNSAYYLYIFGNSDNIYTSLYKPYACKIVIQDNKVIGRYYIDGRILDLFNWYFCESFMPF